MLLMHLISRFVLSCRVTSGGEKQLERLAISSSPKEGVANDNESPMAAQAGSRVGSEGPERSATHSHERKKRGGKAEDPEFVPDQPRPRYES